MSVFDKKYRANLAFTIEDISENPEGSLNGKCGNYIFENEFDSLCVKDIYVLEKIPGLREKVHERLNELFIRAVDSVCGEGRLFFPKSASDLISRDIKDRPSFKYKCKYEISKMGNSYIIAPEDKNSGDKNIRYECEAIFHFIKKWEYIKVALKINLGGRVITKKTDEHWLDFFENYSAGVSQADCASFEGILANIKIHSRKIL